MKLSCGLKAIPLKGFRFLIAFCMLTGGMAHAETASPYTAADGAEVRVVYQSILNATEAIADMYQMQGRERVIAEARNALASATDEELAPFAAALPKIREWRQATDLWVGSLRVVDVLDTKKHDLPELATSDGFPDADYFHLVRPDELAMIIGLEVMNLAEGAQMIASRICEQTAVILGEGGNTSMACMVTDVIFVAAMFVWNTLDQVDNDFNSEENEASYLRLGHIHTDLEDVHDDLEIVGDSVNVISVRQDLMRIVIDSIQSNLEQHRAEFKEWITLALRTKIEQNLARHGQQVHLLAIFVLPAQFGGHLELAREIVAETITNMMAAGQRVYFAEEQLAKGDEEFAAGNYKKAYDYFGAAYLSATK